MSLASVVPPIESHHLLIFLLQVAVLLGLATILGSLAARQGMPRVVGELLTGVLLGPSLLGHAAPAFRAWFLPADPGQAHLLDAVAQMGVLLLVGMTATQLDTVMIRRSTATVLRVSLASLIVPFGLGVAAGYLLPASLIPSGAQRPAFAVLLGVALAVSAIPVIAKTLADMKLLHRNIGQLILATGMIDDAVAWFVLSVVVSMATGGLTTAQFGLTALIQFGFITAAVLIGRPIIRRLVRAADRSPDTPGSLALPVVLIILCGATTHALKMEPVLGAFVAGAMLASAGLSPARLAPIRTVTMAVFAPLFLATAGLRTDMSLLRHPMILLTTLALLAIAVVGKFAGAYLGAHLSRLDHWEGIALGAGLNSRGVVQIVVAAVGLRLGLVNTELFTVLVLIAITTSIMAPPLLRRATAHITPKAEEALRKETFEN